jgi:hypothetical protein
MIWSQDLWISRYSILFFCQIFEGGRERKREEEGRKRQKCER